MFEYVHACVHVFVSIYLSIYLSMYIYIYIHIHIYIYLYISSDHGPAMARAAPGTTFGVEYVHCLATHTKPIPDPEATGLKPDSSQTLPRLDHLLNRSQTAIFLKQAINLANKKSEFIKTMCRWSFIWISTAEFSGASICFVWLCWSCCCISTSLSVILWNDDLQEPGQKVWQGDWSSLQTNCPQIISDFSALCKLGGRRHLGVSPFYNNMYIYIYISGDARRMRW